MHPLLSIKDLSVDFISGPTRSTAIKNISFSVNKGEIVALVGESGSGKSVTSLSILQLLPSPPAHYPSGQILFSENGSEQTDLLKKDRYSLQSIRGNKIAMIFQEPMTSLNPVLKCGDQVMEALLAHKKISRSTARQRTIEWLEKVKLPDPDLIFDRYPHQLSGGQKQRVMIAMAMSCNPRVLIADEPTTALDVTVQKTILDLMLQLQREHDMGIMFITHDLGVIAELADKVMVMYKGKVVEQGPVLEIFSNPKHPYTKSLLACRPPLDKRLMRLPVSADFMSTDEEGNMLEIPTTVSEAINSVIISKEQRAKEHKELYARSKILEIQNLKTYFPNNKTFFG
ncbi:MAG: ATP-binding cassette domain-containing protein, partial [Chitinophagaceae bacterium]